MPIWTELPLVKPVVVSRIQDLSASFSEYVETFIHRGPFSESQLHVHLKALRQRASFASAAEAVSNSAFADDVRDVLRDWGIGSRGAELVPPDVFRAEFTKLASRLDGLEQVRIDDRALDATNVALKVWDCMCLVTNNGQPVKNRLVSGSKALHHVLPALVFPIDREYTQTFFGWHNPEFQNNPRDCFVVIFLALAELANTVKPTSLVCEGWMSTPTKILDNAIVGYCVRRGLKSENSRYQRKKRTEYQAMVQRAKELGIWDAIEAEAAKRADAVPSR